MGLSKCRRRENRISHPPYPSAYFTSPIESHRINSIGGKTRQASQRDGHRSKAAAKQYFRASRFRFRFAVYRSQGGEREQTFDSEKQQAKPPPPSPLSAILTRFRETTEAPATRRVKKAQEERKKEERLGFRGTVSFLDASPRLTHTNGRNRPTVDRSCRRPAI